MGQRLGGARRRTRRTFKKDARTAGKISIAKYFAEFKKGDNVCLQFEPSCMEGRYFHRYHGNRGHIKGKRGDCYEVIVRVSKNDRSLFVHPVHLKKLQ
ncbi:MAG: 50S ribosomal protein L21e [Nanoarchaeota archaeon]